MKHALAPLALAALLLAPAAPAPAAEPEVLASRTFDVSVDRSAGTALVIDFALALSEVDSYPVTITAIAGATEEQLYNGTLSGGIYRLRAPLTRISSGALRVVLRTKVINRSAGGNDVYIVYQKWDGSL
jgi:hypothetical protein